ncbi:MAG: hypothetical protein PF638_11175 [Candidatus Delongbacteria bacterium]|nr:hypothetical protein [Candidatus Delongbacteria bacterium]
MPHNLPKLNETINEIRDNTVKSSLKAASKYLTDLAIRNIVDYIVMLEKSQGE